MAVDPASIIYAAESFTIGAMIESNARHFPDYLAFVDKTRSLTHAQFAVRAKRLADSWHQRGIGKQERVAILSQNRIEYNEVYGAGEIAGFIIATVNYRLSVAEMARVLNDCQPKILIFEDRYTEAVATLRAQCPSIELFICIGPAPDWAEPYEAMMSAGSAEGPPFRARRNDIAYIIYTSGSTGTPKGCILGQHEEWCAALMLHHAQGGGPGSSILLTMPFFHVGSKRCANAQSANGGSVHILPNFVPEEVLYALAEWKIQTALLAPAMLQMVLAVPNIDDYDLSNLKLIIYSAAPMTVPLLKEALARFGNIFINIYGQTEGVGTALMQSQHRPDGSLAEREWLSSVGQPLVGALMRIVDDAGKDCAAGALGEVLVGGGGLFRGYWNNPGETRATLRDGWLYSGDIGRIGTDGLLYLVDRKKDMIISGGENVYSLEVEEALASHQAVSEVAVIGVKDEKWGEAVRAIIVLRQANAVTEQELITHCTTSIARYKTPKSIIFVPDIPKFPSGKINKMELRRLYGSAIIAAHPNASEI